MNRPWKIWLFFSLSLLIVLAAMGWVSTRALKLEREAMLEENVRLALWRLDSSLAPLIVEESSRPYFTYSAFYPAERAYDKMYAALGKGQVVMPSPLLIPATPSVKVHFQFGPDGQISSPQVPTGNMRDLAESEYTNALGIGEFSARLEQLQSTVTRQALLDRTRGEKAPQIVLNRTPTAPPVLPSLPSTSNSRERRKRWSTYQKVAKQQVLSQSFFNCTIAPASTRVTVSTMKPYWVEDTLLLLRRVRIDNQLYMQGCWLDWLNLKTSLLTEVGDLLPNADLIPTMSATPDEDVRGLAALPARLLPGRVASSSASAVIQLPLLIAWVCVLVAALAVAVLLQGVISLSERRGDFVSAVTHELRTPLTTFQLYTELLQKNMVTDEDKRARYLDTLRTESDRLGHMVENVLAYARLENGKPVDRLERISADSILAKVRERLSNRAEQDAARLEIASDLEDPAPLVTGDPAMIEQILLNLVDNACKYGKNGNGANTIHLDVKRHDKSVVFLVRDHGSGVAPELARRLFKPFMKSATEAAHTAPGVGLGLALSRRLARAMGGDLRLDANGGEGTCFALSLALADS